MDSKDEIKSILPKIGGNSQEMFKEKSPRSVMQEFGDVINENYKGYLRSLITETSRIDKRENAEILSYSFYIVAFIGKGYNYKLFEVIPQRKDKPYPLELILFQNNPSNEGLFQSETAFRKKLIAFFQSSFFSNVVNNLSAQVDLYRDSRQETKE